MKKRAARQGPRGLSADAIVKTGVELMETHGGATFSVRKLANAVGCDPMAVLYHFKSKAGLERAMADALNAELRPVDPNAPWRDRLKDLSQQYRELALRYPETFPLLLRFWVTGPADYRHAEMIYAALADAGFDEQAMVDICFGLYASVLGLAAAEIGGMLKPATTDTLAEVRSLDAAAFPVTHRLLPVFAQQEAGRVYGQMIEIILDGVEAASAAHDRPASLRD